MFKRNILTTLFLVALAGCATSPPADVVPVANFDANRYLGKWYEIARLDHRFERGLSRVTADYSMNEDGTIKVLNRGYNATEDKWNEAEGKAKFKGDPSVGSLKVSFFGPFYGGYHIFELDSDYQYAMIAGSNKDYLWILARSPQMDETKYKQLVDKATGLGFPTEDLIAVSHDNADAGR